MKKTISLILCAVLIVTVTVTAIVNVSGKLGATKLEAIPTKMNYNDTEVFEECTVEFADGYRAVIENEGFALGYRMNDASVALLNKKTGYVWYTNPKHSNSTKVKSQLEFFYYNNNTVVGMDSYEYGIEADAIPRYEVDGNSLTVKYELGSNEFELEMMPAVVKKDRFEKEFLSKLTEEERETVLSNYTLFDRKAIDKETYDIMIISYPSLKDSDIYVRPNNIPNYIAEEAYNLLVKAGYTTDDLQKDCNDNGVENTYVEKPFFKAQLKYFLTDYGFAVSLDPSKIEYNKNYIPVKVSILPYFGAADNKESGFMLLPDGSGAITELNNGKVTENVYNKSFFADDSVLTKITTQPQSELSLLPYFGLSNKSGGFIASVDSGYEIGGVTAQISGLNNDFNAVSSYYNLFLNSKVSYSTNANDEFYRFAEHIYSDLINISYHFADNSPSYSELALIYREHLKEIGSLTKSRLSDVSMNITFKGVAKSTKNFLGFNYEAYEAYTTTEQAEKILKNMYLKNIDIRLDNFVNGGEIQEDISSLALESSSGSLNDLKKLYPITKNTFLSLNVQHFSKENKSYASMALSQEAAYGLEFNTATLKKELWRYSVILSPKYFPSAAEKLIKQIQKKEVKAINIEDVGYSFDSDLRENDEIDRYKSRIAVENFLSSISKNAILSVNKGSIYSLKYTDKIWDIPMSSSNYGIEDYSIPFYELVVSGSIPYTTPEINDSSEIHRQFLKAVEYGAQPHFTLIYRKLDSVDYYKDKYYGYLYSNYIDAIKEYYVVTDGLHKKINGAALVSHKYENGVAETVYDNGVKIYINYNDTDITIENITVKSQDFTVTE